jgi:hypothetical protein
VRFGVLFHCKQFVGAITSTSYLVLKGRVFNELSISATRVSSVVPLRKPQ